MKREKIIALIFMLSMILAHAGVRGIITSESGVSLSDVLVKSSLDNAISDNRGLFSIKAEIGDTLLFHRIGFEDKYISVNNSYLKVIMKEAVICLEGSSIQKNPSLEIEAVRVQRIKINDDFKGETLTDLLSKESGLLNNAVKTKGTQQTVSVPGFDARHTLIMLDGIPLNSAGESVDLSLIPLAMIEDIEVIPGNLTSKAASGAMGAVLNIRTKHNSEELYIEAGQEAGSFEYYKTSVFAGLGKKWFDLQISAEFQQAENDFEYDVPDYWNFADDTKTREHNRFRQTDLAAKLQINNKNNFLEYKIFYTDFFRMLPGTVNNPELFYKARISGYMNRQQMQYLTHLKGFKFSTDCWLNQEKSWYDNTRLEYPYSNYPIYCVYGKSSKSTLGIRPVLEKSFPENLNWSLGGEFQQENYEYTETTNPSNSISRISRDTWSQFTKLNWNFTNRTFEAKLYGSLRNDKSSQFASHLSYNLGAGFNWDNYEFSMSWGSSYTLPSFHNLYWKGDAESVGNPDLLPETNSSFLTGLNIDFSNLSLRVNYRYDDIDDMIDWVQTFTKAWKPVNISAAELQNIEVIADFDLTGFVSLSGVWNRTYSKDKTILESGEEAATYGKELIYTPDYNGKIALKLSDYGVNFKLESEFTGSQWTTRDQLTDTKQIKACQLYNAAIGYEFSLYDADFNLNFSINNIADKFYQLYDYIPQPGRNYNLTISIKKRS